MLKHRLLPRLVVAFLLILISCPLWGQSGDAQVTGLVKDQTGAPVSGATLSLVNADSGITRSAASDGEGRYTFVSIPPGRYSLKTEATGFKSEAQAIGFSSIAHFA